MSNKYTYSLHFSILFFVIIGYDGLNNIVDDYMFLYDDKV